MKNGAYRGLSGPKRLLSPHARAAAEVTRPHFLRPISAFCFLLFGIACTSMDARQIVDGLIMYLGLIVLLTFHEFGHAWMAMRCGDDTARLQGRVSLNPLVHIDPIGTVFLPLLIIFLSMSGSGVGRFLIGWAKPVPVNLYNLRN